MRTPTQLIIDQMLREERDKRSQSQMTLGGLIECYAKMSPGTIVDGISHPHSYRGYYDDLAFEKREEMTAEEAITVARSAMGKLMCGYKGGDYMMGESTPVWIAPYGATGVKIVSVDDRGRFKTAEDD